MTFNFKETRAHLVFPKLLEVNYFHVSFLSVNLNMFDLITVKYYCDIKSVISSMHARCYTITRVSSFVFSSLSRFTFSFDSIRSYSRSRMAKRYALKWSIEREEIRLQKARHWICCSIACIKPPPYIVDDIWTRSKINVSYFVYQEST